MAIRKVKTILGVIEIDDEKEKLKAEQRKKVYLRKLLLRVFK